MSGFFQIVRQDLARNFVARAVQRDNVAREMRTFRISLYMLESGSEQVEAIQAAAIVLAVAIRVLECRGELYLTPASVMLEAFSALQGMAENGHRWRASDAPAIDVGMGYAVDVHAGAKAAELQKAWSHVREMEIEAVK